MISVVSLGSKFSGGGVVLHEIISKVREKLIQIEVVEPLQVKSKHGQKLLQVLWILFWPFRALGSKNSTVLVAHSLFLLSPFIFLLYKRNLFFLFQGEEYRALRWPLAIRIIEWLLKGRFKHFKCITTNQYLFDVASAMGGKPLPLKTQLGPKQNFFKLEKLSALPQNVVVFARDGYNKGLYEALQVAFLVRNALPFHFITPDKAIAIKLRNQGFQCTVTVSPEEVHERLLNALALFLPSHYEGLSLPLLEALAVGVPVVTYAEGFPYFYSKVNDHVKFVRNRDPITASQILIELSQKNINDLNRTPLINRVIFSFEAYCDEVAMVLLSSIKV